MRPADSGRLMRPAHTGKPKPSRTSAHRPNDVACRAIQRVRRYNTAQGGTTGNADNPRYVNSGGCQDAGLAGARPAARPVIHVDPLRAPTACATGPRSATSPVATPCCKAGISPTSGLCCGNCYVNCVSQPKYGPTASEPGARPGSLQLASRQRQSPGLFVGHKRRFEGVGKSHLRGVAANDSRHDLVGQGLALRVP